MANKARDFVAKFISDTSKFDTDKPIDQLDDLADASDQTSRRMDDSFGRIRRSSNDNLDKIGTEGGGRAREAGREVGAELAENMGEAFRSGDIGSLVTESLTSLAPALGALGIGVGLGAALVSNMIKGVKEAQERLTVATQTVIDNIDVDLTTFATKFDVSKFLNDSIANLTEGGLEQDIAKFKKLARGAVGEDTLTRILAGEPTAEDKAKIQQLVATTSQGVTAIGREARQAQIDQRDQAQEVLDLLDRQTTAYSKGVDAVETQVDAQKRLAGYIRTANGLLDQQSIKGLGRFAGKKLPTDDA